MKNRLACRELVEMLQKDAASLRPPGSSFLIAGRSSIAGRREDRPRRPTRSSPRDGVDPVALEALHRIDHAVCVLGRVHRIGQSDALSPPFAGVDDRLYEQAVAASARRTICGTATPATSQRVAVRVPSSFRGAVLFAHDRVVASAVVLENSFLRTLDALRISP